MRQPAEPVARLLLTFWLALLARSDMALAVSPLLHHSHEVLQADFCSGYIDQFGKWNTGFPCPWVDSTVPGFCCGTEHYKYCCSGKMMVAPAPPPPPEDPLLLVLAITLGVAAGITLLILVACFVCPGCLLHKKRRPGPLYRLPCSSTMSTYVPSATNGPAAQSAHHQSASFQSFNSASGSGGVSSLYSLTEPLCPASGQPGRAAVISSGPLTGEDPGSGEMNRPCHHLYWNRPSLSRASSLNHQRQPQPQQPQQLQHLLPVRQAITNHQGHLRSYQDDASPPPPYDADFQQLHQVEAGSSRATSVSAGSGHRAHHHHHHHHHHVHPASQSHAGPAEMPGFRQPVSSISPRQPALCIIDDVRRVDDPPLAYHSTKF